MAANKRFQPPEWHEDTDEQGNTIYRLNSRYHDEGTPFVYEIRKRLQDNKVIFYFKHDTELLSEGQPKFVHTLKRAKEIVEKLYQSELGT